jgi:hypothetical protein
MGLTNEQTVETIRVIGEQVVRAVGQFAEQAAKQQTEWLEKNESEHAEYRRSMAELAQALVLLQAEHQHTRERVASDKDTNDKRWGRVVGIAMTILTAVVIAVLGLVLK